MSSVIENKLPVDWSIKQLGQVGDIVTGNTPSKKNSDYWSEKSGYMFVKPPNLGTGNIVLSTNEMLTKEGFKKANPIPKNSIMVCCIGSLGKIGIAGKELATNQQINSISFYNEIVEFKFGYYFALTLKSHMHKIANKAIVQIINKTSFSKIEIPIPPLEEQKRIVAKIDTLFAKIDKAISLTEESLKQAKNLLPSVLKEIFDKGKEDGWEEKKLGDIAFLKSGSTPSRSNNSYWDEGTIPWLKSGELNDVMGIKENSEFITEIALNETSVKLFEKDTLLIAMYGATAGKLGILSIDATTNQAVCSIQNKKRMFNNHFVFYFLFSIREKIIGDSFGGAQPNISKTYLENLTLCLPDLSIQEVTVSLCNELSLKAKQTQSKLEKQIAYLKQLKSSILSKAFKGEL